MGTRSRLHRPMVAALLLALAAAVLALLAPEAMGSMRVTPPAASGTPSSATVGSTATQLSATSTPLSTADVASHPGTAAGITYAADPADPAETGQDQRGTQPVAVAGEVPPPVRVRIPSIGVDSALDPLATATSGELEAPPRWQVAGWFSGGVRPGETGPAVIAGHIDSPTGPAIFAELPDLRAGALVDVTQRGGDVVHFRVDRTQVAAKDTFPTRAVYGRTPDSQLRLITCDGPYVAASGGYQDNLIVYATRLPEDPR